MQKSIFIAGKPDGELSKMTTGFKNYGYDIIIVDGKDAVDTYLKSAKRLEAVLIAADYDEQYGTNLCQTIKDNSHKSTTPTFIMDGGQANVNKLKAMGFYNFIKGPLSATKIVQKIRTTQKSMSVGPVAISDVQRQMMIAGIIFAMGVVFLCFVILF